MSHIHNEANMNKTIQTTILDQLDLPEEVREVARRQAMKRGVPIGQVLSEWVIETAKRLVPTAPGKRAA